MQSKTLCFNRTLFRKNLTRFWPLWAVPSFVGALFPLAMLTHLLRYGADGLFGRCSSHALEFTGIYYDAVSYVLPIISLCYAILVALAVWSYLFNNRSTGLMHTLPIRREGLFLTNFLSGMAMILVPYVVTGALCILISLCFGFFEPVGPLVTILAVLGDSLFYFCTATAAAFVTGNLFALPVLYFIFHFLATGMDVLISAFAGGFLFGVEGSYSGSLDFLSPTVYLMRHVETRHEYEEIFVPDSLHGSLTADGIGYYDSQIVSVTLENAWIIAVYALVGVVLLAVAYALYRRRRSESAGDVVAVGWMKPVFRYGVAVCASMAGGLALYMVFWGQFQNGETYDALPMLIAMIVSGAIGYYAASMLLAKSLRVFRGSWKGLAVMALCAAVICGVMKFDVFGIETRVPTADKIETLTFRVANNQYDLTLETDADLLENVRAAHLAIAEDADYIRSMDRNESRLATAFGEELSAYNTVRLTYHLKNGTTVNRRYSVPITADRLTQEGTYDSALDRLVNGTAMKAKRFHLDDGYKADNGYLYLESRRDSGVTFGTHEAMVIHEAVKRDIAAGTCGNYNWFDNGRAGQYAMELNLDFRLEEKAENGATRDNYDYINVAVYPAMTHTVEALLALNLAEESDLKTYAEMHPEDYNAQYQEYLEKYGYVEYDDYLAVRYAAGTLEAIDLPAASVGVEGGFDEPVVVEMTPNAAIGVIGGADAPTEVFVTAG